MGFLCPYRASGRSERHSSPKRFPERGFLGEGWAVLVSVPYRGPRSSVLPQNTGRSPSLFAPDPGASAAQRYFGPSAFTCDLVARKQAKGAHSGTTSGPASTQFSAVSEPECRESQKTAQAEQGSFVSITFSETTLARPLILCGTFMGERCAAPRG